jgi:hypothetical protein
MKIESANIILVDVAWKSDEASREILLGPFTKVMASEFPVFAAKAIMGQLVLTDVTEDSMAAKIFVCADDGEEVQVGDVNIKFTKQEDIIATQFSAPLLLPLKRAGLNTVEVRHGNITIAKACVHATLR